MSELLGIIAPLRKLLAQSEQTISINDQEVLKLNPNRKYIIPDFQREIRWDEDNVSLLIDDLKSGKCYLGNIILTQHPNNTFSIIDGQQRLTVITMLIHCIRRLHGERIEVLVPCALQVDSFNKLETLFQNDFSEECFSSEGVQRADKLHQSEKYLSLWKYIKSHPIISNQREAAALLTNIEGSNVNLIINQSDDIREGIRYFIDVNLKGKQLDPEDIFKSFLFKNDSGEEIRTEWYNLKTNVVLAEKRSIQYPLLKYIEHYFYCDLYADPKYKGLEFSDDFKLKKEFKTKEENPQTFRKDCHLIEVIADKHYMLNALRRLNNSISIMTEIAGSSRPTNYFTELFPCIPKNAKPDSLDNDELDVIHNIMRKMLRDSNLLPKALLMKYILSIIDKQPKSKKEYRKIYGVYLLSVLFVVFENKKSKDVLLSVLKADENNWYSEAVTQIKSYFSPDRITDSRLLAQYKLGVNEDGEDYQFRCKSLATIYDYFEIRGMEVSITNPSKLKEFLTSEEKYSTEHFIISKSASRKMKVSIGDAVVDYELEEKCYKSYVNSIFNFVFIPKELNSKIGNNWLPKKENLLAAEPKEIECSYSKMVMSKAQILSDAFSALPLTEENYSEKLYLFFARDFRDKYIEYSREVLKAVIERIKGNT